jgi:DNA-binding GntR family transcriptional regulator
MSRTPLREVLQKLAGEGFVDITQNKGAKVVSMDMAVMRSFFQNGATDLCQYRASCL